MHKTRKGEGNFIVWQIRYFKKYLSETLFPRHDYPNAPTPLHYKPDQLIGFSLFSALCFISTFFLVRITHNLLYSLFLRANHINHTYSILNIDFHVGKVSNWTEGKLLFIHTIPFIVYLVAGIVLPMVVKELRSWTGRLFTTWAALNLLIFFMAELIQGLVVYDGLGVALTWFVYGVPLRIIVVLLFVFLIMIGVKKFGVYFLQSAPHYDFTDDYKHIRCWFTYSLFIPFMIGFVGIFLAGDLLSYFEYFLSFIIGLLCVYLIFQTILEIYVSAVSTEKPLRISPLVTIPAIIIVVITIISLKAHFLINYVN